MSIVTATHYPGRTCKRTHRAVPDDDSRVIEVFRAAQCAYDCLPGGAAEGGGGVGLAAKPVPADAQDEHERQPANLLL